MDHLLGLGIVSNHGRHRNHKAYLGRGDGAAEWGMEVGEGVKDIRYLSLHCHHQNDFCFKMGSDERYFKVPLIVRDKVTRQCLQTTTSEKKGEPKRNRTEVLLLTSLTPYH